MSPEEVRAVTDPLERERVARVEMEALSRQVEAYSSIRASTLQDLHRQLGSWRALAERVGLSVAAVYKAAGR